MSDLFPRRSPCAGCPMSDHLGAVRLNPGRRAEIAASLADDFQHFHCHRTVDYSGDEPDATAAHPCAGAELLRWRSGRQSVMGRYAARSGGRRPEDYDGFHVPWADLDTWAAEAPDVGDR